MDFGMLMELEIQHRHYLLQERIHSVLFHQHHLLHHRRILQGRGQPHLDYLDQVGLRVRMCLLQHYRHQTLLLHR